MAKTPIIIGVLVLIIAGALVWYFGPREASSPSPTPVVETEPGPTPGDAPTTFDGVQQETHEAQVITLTADGFVPSTLALHVGDTVTFTSTAGKKFWPASNVHPSHLAYPEFDPKGPIEPSASWSFTFTKAGEWKFHDHLAPYNTGVITVGE